MGASGWGDSCVCVFKSCNTLGDLNGCVCVQKIVQQMSRSAADARPSCDRALTLQVPEPGRSKIAKGIVDIWEWVVLCDLDR